MPSGHTVWSRPAALVVKHSLWRPVLEFLYDDTRIMRRRLLSLAFYRLQVPRRVPQDPAVAAAQPAQAALLAVNPRALKGDDELRRIFGSRVVDAGERDDDAGAVPGMHRIPCFTAHARTHM